MDNQRISFGSIVPVLDVPDLLNIQNETFEDFIQMNVLPENRTLKGLQKVFLDNFPILSMPLISGSVTFDNLEVSIFFNIFIIFGLKEAFIFYSF